jgi:hypothetical protein
MGYQRGRVGVDPLVSAGINVERGQAQRNLRLKTSAGVNARLAAAARV